MSEVLRGFQRRVDDWDDFGQWVADCINALDTGDVFEIGPANVMVGEDVGMVPCPQAMALDGAILLRLSTEPMGVPLLTTYSSDGIALDTWRHDSSFEDCTDGFIASAEVDLLAAATVTWFRDRHGIPFDELGCGHHAAVSLAEQTVLLEEELPADWDDMSLAAQEGFIAEALRRAGLEEPEE